MISRPPLSFCGAIPFSTLTKIKLNHFMAHTKKSNPVSQEVTRGINSKTTSKGCPKAATGGRKPPTQREPPLGERKTLPDEDTDYVELRRGRSKKENKKDNEAVHLKSNRNSPRKDSMGFINPDHIDKDSFEDEASKDHHQHWNHQTLTRIGHQ